MVEREQRARGIERHSAAKNEVKRSLSPVRRQSLQQIFASRLLEDIENGTFPLGSRLPNRIDLAARYEMSTKPIGHAMPLLASVVILRPRVGYYVAENLPKRKELNALKKSLQGNKRFDMEKWRKPTSRKKIAYELLQKITSGHYPPGSVLPNTEDMVIAYGVSRATLDPVLNMLEEHEFVERRQGVGTSVKDILPPQQVIDELNDVLEPKERTTRKPARKKERPTAWERAVIDGGGIPKTEVRTFIRLPSKSLARQLGIEPTEPINRITTMRSILIERPSGVERTVYDITQTSIPVKILFEMTTEKDVPISVGEIAHRSTLTRKISKPSPNAISIFHISPDTPLTQRTRTYQDKDSKTIGIKIYTKPNNRANM